MNEKVGGFIDDEFDVFYRDAQSRWRISARDAEILAEIKEVLRCWIPALLKTKDIVAVAAALEDLGRLIDSGAPPLSSCEIGVKRVASQNGGISANVSISSCEISLDCSEWVPNLNGSLDSGSLLARDGRPLLLLLDRMGSYDRDLFDQWWFKAMDIAPHEPRDQSAKGWVNEG